MAQLAWANYECLLHAPAGDRGFFLSLAVLSPGGKGGLDILPPEESSLVVGR